MNPVTYELLIDLTWSAGGGVVGYFLGRVTRTTIESEVGSPMDPTPRRSRSWHDWMTGSMGNLLGVVLLLLVCVGMWSGYQRLECQASAGRAYSAGTVELREAAAIEREANRIRWAFIKEALAAEPPPSISSEDRRTAQLRWLDDLRRADALIDTAEAKRAASPPPPLRECR